MAKLRKKKALASSAEDVAAIEAQTAAIVDEATAIEAEIDAKVKAVLKNEQAEAESRELEKEAQVNADPLAALVPAPQAPPVEIISQETPAVNGELASDEASSDLQKFEALDAEIYADIDDWADRLRALKQEFRDRILPKIYVMWEFLSERGSMHFAGSLLPKWGDWRDRCIATLRKKMNMSKSTLERELKLFRDEQDGNADIVDKNDIDSSNGQQTEDFGPVEERDPVSLLKEHCKQVNDALSGTSIKSEDERIARVAELNENLALAINDGLLDGPDKTEPTAAAEKVYKLLAPMLYNHYLLGVQVRWWDAEKAYKTTGEEVPDDVRVAYYENFIVRNRKYAPYPESLNVPWPNLKVDNSLEVSTRLAKGYGPPMWFCIEEPNGDTVECLIDRAGSGKCTRVRRTKQDSPATADDNSMEAQVLCEAPSAIEDVPESEETEQALVPDDDIDHELVPLSELAKRLRGVSYELDYHCLDGFRDDIDAIADRIEDREELDKRMVNFEKRMSRSPNGVSARWLYKQIRRDRRFANEMKNILRDGGTTYRGQKIIGTKDEPYVWRYTRDEVKAELKGDRPNQLGKPSVWRPTPREMMLAAQENQDETALEHITEEQPEFVAVSELEPESMGHQEATALVTIEPAPESIGLPGCTYIYAPAGQANEFAPLAANPYKGCGHGCTYCFNTTRKNKKQKATFHDGAVPRKDYLTLLLKDAKKYQAAGITEQVTLCFSTDAYNPFDTSLTRPTLEIIQQHGMGICVLTKGGTRALADIDLYRPDRDCFASTLTGLDAAFVSKWEPCSASPDDRIAALKAFNKKGIFTWVSLEPTLNVEASLSIVEATHEFVNLYKIGKVNYCKELSDTIDWRDYTLRMIDLCQRLGVKHYIKRDLQPYLPVGYHNPMRVAQHF